MKLEIYFLIIGLTVAACAKTGKRQVGSAVITEDEEDREVAETGFSDAVQQGSKYFQYAHVPAKDHYEFGHRRGNDHHFIERHEKAQPHVGEFKTKVRWGDKHGGYGEHYWDYNHAGHGDGNGEESQQDEEYASYEGSEKVPVIVKGRQRRALLDGDDVEFIDDRARSLVESGVASKHGGNYKRENSDYGIKRKRQNGYRPKYRIDTHSEYKPQSEKEFLNYDY